MSKKISGNDAKNAVHFTLQGKGGVGKSLVSAFLAQYFVSQEGCDVKCFDTDPINQTFAAYSALKAQHLELMSGAKIDERNFDKLMECLLSETATFVVDNGASSFVPLSNYLIENNAIEMLEGSGKEVFIHCVITGGQSMLDTLQGFKLLAEQAKSRNIVIWINEFFGVVEVEGKTFKEMAVYLNNAEKIRGIVRIQKRNQDTFGKDIELMAASRLTFDEAINGNGFTIMSKQRIKTVKTDIFSQLSAVGF